MPTYLVTVEEVFTVTIEADTEAEAEDLAMEEEARSNGSRHIENIVELRDSP